MLKIITKSAHNALLYQIEDLKKKLETQIAISKTYRDDINILAQQKEESQDMINNRNIKINELTELLDSSNKKYAICVECLDVRIVKVEDLKVKNRSLLKDKINLKAENHRLGNLLQVKCDEVKALEKKVDNTGLLTKDFNQLKANADAIERKTLDAVNMLLNIPRRAKAVNSAITILKDALKIRQ